MHLSTLSYLAYVNFIVPLVFSEASYCWLRCGVYIFLRLVSYLQTASSGIYLPIVTQPLAHMAVTHVDKMFLIIILFL